MYRLRAKRTTGSNPPAELLFGELAYSDTNKRLYVGRADGSPCTFESDLSLSPITEAITALDATTDAQAIAIAALNAASDSQADAITTLATNTATALAAKLEAANIADFETTTELNARDTANRDRANHTGTQPASTVSGLAAVATSGAYANLLGKPTIPYGFNYDQQAEPVEPTAGATWRERSAEGLTVGVWEWNGVYWVQPGREYAQIFSVATQVTATTGLYASPMPPPFRLLGYTFQCAVASTPQTGADYWTIEGINSGIVIDTRNTSDITTNSESSYTVMLSTPIVKLASDRGNNSTLTRMVRNGVAGLIRRPTLIAIYQRIRA